jgi:hypothetical protein
MAGPLDPLIEATAAKERVDLDAFAADQTWREEIRKAIAHGFKISVIAEAAGVTTTRIYQIRDNTR